jgi:hypothetical protein
MMECSADGGLEEGSHVAGGLELWVSCWSASGWSLWGGYRWAAGEPAGLSTTPSTPTIPNRNGGSGLTEGWPAGH